MSSTPEQSRGRPLYAHVRKKLTVCSSTRGTSTLRHTMASSYKPFGKKPNKKKAIGTREFVSSC
eukprot:1190044-Prorocentrum_minimum.AAC.3